MRNLFCSCLAICFIALCTFASCKSGGAAKTFCDTACGVDSLTYNGTDSWESNLRITLNECEPDSIGWSYKRLGKERQIKFREYVTRSVRVNKSSVSVAFQDTTNVWLTMNDCISGRGYLLVLPFNSKNVIRNISSALTTADPKFSVAPELRAYSDGGNIYVSNVQDGKEATMTFKEDYKVDFNRVHDFIDSIHVTKDRIFVQLLKNGTPVTLEKKIAL